MRKVVLLLLLLPSAVMAQDPSATEQADPGIVFVSMRDGIEDIYVMEADGTNVRRVTVTESIEGENRGSWVPAWSPDGGRIVFASNRDDGGSANLYVVNVDGSADRIHVHTGWSFRCVCDGRRRIGHTTPDGGSEESVLPGLVSRRRSYCLPRIWQRPHHERRRQQSPLPWPGCATPLVARRRMDRLCQSNADPPDASRRF